MEALLSTFAQWRQRDALTDEDLIALARNRDEGAVRALVQRHNRRLFRIARGLVRDDREAEDIVQETYVRAFTSLDRFRGDSEFGTWLTRIALNEAYGRLRRKRPTVDITEIEESRHADGGQVIMFPLSSDQANPESETGREQVRQFLEQAVDHLPEPFRMVFILRDVEGLSTEAAAALLSIKPATVKTRLFRARRLIRTEIEKTLAADFSEVFPFAGERCARMADQVVERLRARI
jgi:RNA polymerase sigma-70 factor, ECF subfamily